MSSLMSSHGMAFATAMAVSGTVILMVLCRQKPLSTAAAAQFAASDRRSLRPCIASAERKRERVNKKKKKKRVRFAEDVVVEFEVESSSSSGNEEELMVAPEFAQIRDRIREMPANRTALYNGILQDRLQRMACY